MVLPQWFKISYESLIPQNTHWILHTWSWGYHCNICSSITIGGNKCKYAPLLCCAEPLFPLELPVPKQELSDCAVQIGWAVSIGPQKNGRVCVPSFQNRWRKGPNLFLSRVRRVSTEGNVFTWKVCWKGRKGSFCFVPKSSSFFEKLFLWRFPFFVIECFPAILLVVFVTPFCTDKKMLSLSFARKR